MNSVIAALLKAKLIRGGFFIRKINKGIDNQNYLINTLGKKSKFILKIYSSDSTEEIRYEIEILNKLNSVNKTRKYFPIPRSNIFYIYSKPSVLFNYIPGRTLTIKDIIPSVINKIAAKQAEMHRSLVGYSPRYKKSRFSIFDFEFVNLYMLDKNNKYYTLIKNFSGQLKREARFIKKANLQKSVIHEDLNIDNIIIDSNGNIQFIDFGDSHLAEIISDIATAIKELILNHKGVDFGLIRNYLDSYQKVNRLNANEINLLPFLLKRRTLFMLIYLIYKYNKSKDYKLKKRIDSEAKILESLNDRYDLICSFIKEYYYA